MKQQDLIKKLEFFKKIEPDVLFLENSKRLIFSFEPNRRFSVFDVLKPALWGSAAVLAIAFMTVYIIGARTKDATAYNSLSSEKLNNEFKNMNISIQLDEISYRQSVNGAVASALKEISNDGTRHLNNEVLMSENDRAHLETRSSGQIDELLDTVIF